MDFRLFIIGSIISILAIISIMSNKFLAVAQLAYFKSIAKSFSTNYNPKKEKFVVTMYRNV